VIIFEAEKKAEKRTRDYKEISKCSCSVSKTITWEQDLPSLPECNSIGNPHAERNTPFS
jgi:hypothetical protein